MEPTVVRASIRRRWVRFAAAAALLLAAVAGLRTLDADPAAAQDPDVTWDDSWAEENYNTFIQETGADPADVPAEPNRDSTPEDWEAAVVAMGDQLGWNQAAALRVIGTLDPGYAVSREEAARIMCNGIGCSSDDTEDQITSLANEAITTGRTHACDIDPNSQACIDDFDADSTTTNAQAITLLSRALDRSSTMYYTSNWNLSGGPVRNLRLTCNTFTTTPLTYAIRAVWSEPAGGGAAYHVKVTGSSFWHAANSTGGLGFTYTTTGPGLVWATVRTMARGVDGGGAYLYVNGYADAGPTCRTLRDVSVVGPVSAQEGSPLVFTLELASPMTSDVTVYVSTQEDTRSGARPATAGDDYIPHPATSVVADRTLVTIPAGDLQATVNVDTAADSADEYYETLILRIESVSGTANPMVGDPREAVGTIIDDDNALPEISVDDGSGDEAGMVTFNVNLAEPSGKVVATSIRTLESSPRSATEAPACGVDDASTDYLAKGGRVIFDPGETSKEFAVQACDDSAEEGHEMFDVELSNPTNAVLGVMSAEGVIRDDDIPVLNISGPSGSVDEDTGGVANTATFTVTLDRVGLRTITVTVSTTSGTASGDPCVSGGDFVYRTRTVTFAPGERTKSFDVTTCADTVPENDEAFNAVISSQSSNAALGTDTAASATIADNDEPTMSISAPPAAVNEDTGGIANTLTFTVNLDVAHVEYVVAETITASGTATGGTCGSAGVDYEEQTIWLVFDPGDTSEDFVVSTCPDAVTGEGLEEFTVSLGYTSNSALGADTATGIIYDGAPPEVSLTGPVSATEGGALLFEAQLAHAAPTDVTVTVSTAADPAAAHPATATGTQRDYQPRTGAQVTIPAGSLSQTARVFTAGDTADEHNETLLLRIDTVASTIGGTIGAVDTAVGTIVDNDPAPEVSISDASAGETGTMTFDVTLSAVSHKTVTVTASTAASSPISATGISACSAVDGSEDYETRTALITYPAGTTAAPFTVTVCDDTAIEPDETFTVTLSGAANATISATAGAATGIIVDDDTAVCAVWQQLDPVTNTCIARTFFS